jgi:hypothetical protein
MYQDTHKKKRSTDQANMTMDLDAYRNAIAELYTALDHLQTASNSDDYEDETIQAELHLSAAVNLFHVHGPAMRFKRGYTATVPIVGSLEVTIEAWSAADALETILNKAVSDLADLAGSDDTFFNSLDIDRTNIQIKENK